MTSQITQVFYIVKYIIARKKLIEDRKDDAPSQLSKPIEIDSEPSNNVLVIHSILLFYCELCEF